MPIALNHSSTCVGIGAAPVIASSTASSPTSVAHHGERHAVEEVERCLLLVGEVTVEVRPADLDRRVDAVVELGLAVGVGGERRVHAVVDLLPHPRDAERELRVDLFEILRELVGVGAAVDVVAEHHRLVVTDGPLRDVSHRQVRHHPHAHEVVEMDRALEDLDRVHDVVLADHHALRWPRGARGVDQGRDVVGLGERSELGKVGAAGGEEFGGLVDTIGQRSLGRLDHVDEFECGQFVTDLQDPVEEPLVLDDRDACLGMTGEVLDLFRRRRVVDAHGRGAQELRGGIEPVEVRAVAHHQQHLLSSAGARSGQPGRRLGDLVGEFLDRPAVPAAVLAHRVQRR